MHLNDTYAITRNDVKHSEQYFLHFSRSKHNRRQLDNLSQTSPTHSQATDLVMKRGRVSLALTFDTEPGFSQKVSL